MVHSRILTRPYAASPDASSLLGLPRISRPFQLRVRPWSPVAVTQSVGQYPVSLVRLDSGGEVLTLVDGSVLRFKDPPPNGFALMAAAITTGFPDLWLVEWTDDPADHIEPGPSAPSLKGGLSVATANSDRPTYVANFNLAPGAGVMDLVTLRMGGKLARLRRIGIMNPGFQTTAGLVVLQLALGDGSMGTGGTALTCRSLEASDANANAQAYVGNQTTTAGLLSNPNYHAIPVWVPAAAGAFQPIVLDFGGQGGVAKAPTAGALAPGGNNTLVLRHPGAAGSTGFAGFMEWTEEGN